MALFITAILPSMVAKLGEYNVEAIILAGGYGTRLRSVVADVPKPMAPVQSKPFLAYLLDRLEKFGFSKVILTVGYQSQVIMDYFGDQYKSLLLTYSIEEELLGTGGAIKKACEYSDSKSVFVINGDTFVEVDYKALLQHHLSHGSSLTMTLKTLPDVSRYGSVNVKDGAIVSFTEKGLVGPGLINAGVYLLNKNIFDVSVLPNVFSFENQLLFPFVEKIKPLAFVTDGYFIDIGIPVDYERAQVELPKLMG